MNYFELFDIPVSFHPDTNRVRAKFYELSRKYHPDFYGNATAEEQAEALEKSSEVNKAFRIFSKPDETIKYVLQLNGLLEEEEKFELPKDFLMEMMELNEQAAEGDPAKMPALVQSIETEIYTPVKDILAGYRHGETPESDLQQVKEYYFKKKYLNRVMQGLG